MAQQVLLPLNPQAWRGLIEGPSYDDPSPGYPEAPEPVEKRNRVEYQPIPYNGRYTPLPAEDFNTDPSRTDILFQIPADPQNGQSYHPSLIIPSQENTTRQAVRHTDGMLRDMRPGSLIRQPEPYTLAQQMEG